jgi:ABC-type amino acid transport substrate-binding protein
VVYDAPNLLYYANGEGRGKATVVGKIFKSQDYGLAMPEGSPLREKINRAILKLIESGEMERIKRKWFGNQSGG